VHKSWAVGVWNGEGSWVEFVGELGGTTRAGCEEDSKSEIGPGLKLEEFHLHLMTYG
jgi:hypothetical protein